MADISPGDIFKPISLNEKVRISLSISLKFVPSVPSTGSDNGLAPTRRQAII